MAPPTDTVVSPKAESGVKTSEGAKATEASVVEVVEDLLKDVLKETALPYSKPVVKSSKTSSAQCSF